MKKVFCLLFTGMLFFCCDPKLPEEPEEPEKSEEPEEWPKGQNVYVAGFENVQDNPVARVWKNGKLENLAGKNNNSRAVSVFVD